MQELEAAINKAWEEKVYSRSGRINSAKSQKTVEKAVILMGAGASQILLLYKTAGWKEDLVGLG